MRLCRLTATATGTDSEPRSSSELDIHPCLPGENDLSKGSSTMSEAGPGIIR